MIIVALAVVVGATMWYLQQQRSRQLRARFGPEYDRSLEAAGDRRRAEAELLKREERVEHLDIRPLTQQDRDRFADS